MFGNVSNIILFNKFLNENLSDLKYEKFKGYHKEYLRISNNLKSFGHSN